MISQFSIDYPMWSLIFPVLIGLIYAAILYWRNKKNKLSNFYNYLLFFFRFLSVGLICLLLLKPFVKTTQKKIQNPKLIIAIDNSMSMMATKDSVSISKYLSNNLSNTISKFEDEFDIEIISFGEDIKFQNPDFTDNYSDYSQLLKYIDEHYSPTEVEALILIGDGIYNKGQRPGDIIINNYYKIYTLGVGDTSNLADIKINDISYNSINYLNENVAVELNFSAIDMRGEKVKLKTYQQGKFIDSRNIEINNQVFNKTINFSFTAKEAGKMHLKFVLESEIEENNTKNNESDIYIDIIDSKQKILLLANSPHPDLSALKQSLESFKNYSIDIKFAYNKIENLENYNLLILHQLPSSKYKIQKLLQEASNIKLATIGIVGEQTHINSLRNYFQNSGISSGLRNYGYSTATINANFSYFKIDNIDKELIEKLPPLHIPLLNFSGIDNSKVLAWQKINNIKSNFPLIYFTDDEGIKKALIMGTGLWKWRNHVFMEKKNFSDFDNIISKIVQFLSVKEDKRRLRVHSNGEYFIPGKINLQAEFYNKSFEPIEDAEINLELTNEKKEKFDFIFTPDNGIYKLDIQSLETGNYKFRARTKYKDEIFSDNGAFVVTKNKKEFQQLKANFNQLYKLSSISQGHFFEFNNYDSVNVYLENINTSKRISYSTTYKGLNNLAALLAIILILLISEWFIRKYMGSY
ncbi:MAG: hypothetical protein C0595_12680 [Marinilabiliales bacterium]|nr:MAG: hypothetical protein C0595_12680 [Marinilabiliales bacterium]